VIKYFPATVELAAFSSGADYGIGVGVLSASRPGTIFDMGGRLFGIITYALIFGRMLMQLILLCSYVGSP